MLQQLPHVDGLEPPTISELKQFKVRSYSWLCTDVGNNHWITVSNIGCPEGKVDIYDSLRYYPSNLTYETIASIVHSSTSQLQTNVMKVTQQTNGSDCGVLAIAFAYNLYSGQNLCNVRYDRQLIRQGCLEGCRFSRFPRSCNGIVTCPVSRTRTVYLCSECHALACRIDVHCLCFL